MTDALAQVHTRKKEEGVQEYSLQLALEASKKAVLQGSMDVLLVIYENYLNSVSLFLKNSLMIFFFFFFNYHFLSTGMHFVGIIWTTWLHLLTV